MIEKPYAITRTCPTCRGKGTIVAPRCRLCDQPVLPDDPWWEEEGPALPCGHPETALQMEVTCAVCGGNGRVTERLSAAEWRDYWRRRRLRWIFVIGLSLLFLGTMLFVVLREPELLCGNFWYGTILVTAAMRLHQRS